MIEELEEKWNFTFIPQITFKNSEVEKQLLEEGLKNSVQKEHLENGRKYREKILASYIPKVSVRFINETVGCGLFLEEDLEKDTYFGEYVGIIRKNNDHLFISDYLHAYPILDELGRNYVIDAHTGCLTRFINHSYTPNLNTTYAYFDGFYHMILTTNQLIKKGTQVSFNYGKNYWIIRRPPKSL